MADGLDDPGGRNAGEPTLTRRSAIGVLSALAITAACGRAETAAGPPPTSPPSPTMPPPNPTSSTVLPPPATPNAAAATSSAEQRFLIAAAHAHATPTQWGTSMFGLTEHVPGTSPPTMALTFDACGGPGGTAFDAPLLELLVREAIPATLFLNSRWIDANPKAVELLLLHPQFEIANHGSRHVPLSVSGRSAYGIRGTRSSGEVVEEVIANHDRLTSLTGRPPRWFRPGTAHYDDVAVRITADLGIHPIGFAVNGDEGAKASAPSVTNALTRAPAGAVVLLHMNRPRGGTATGLAKALPILRQRGVQFVTMTP